MIVFNKQRLKMSGAVALVTGCCVGAGMLALPLVSVDIGFIVSSVFLLLSGIYMLVSGMMILEVYLHYGNGGNFMTLLENTLGKIGKIIGTVLFLFLFYSILVAYLNGVGFFIQKIAIFLLNWNIPLSWSVLCSGVCLFSFLIKKLGVIERVNRYLFISMMGLYLLLLIFVLSCSRGHDFNNGIFYWKALLRGIPVFVLSFGFQNLIPTLSTYLNNDRKQVRFALFFGVFLAFVIYFLWNLVVLLITRIPREFFSTDYADLRSLFIQSTDIVSLTMQGFSFLALITSMVGVGISVMYFIADRGHLKNHRYLYSLCTICPPMVFAFFWPNIFVKMLQIAGGIGTFSLFGLLPPIMVWKKRYQGVRFWSFDHFMHKLFLIGFFMVSIALISIEIMSLL